MSEPGKQPCLLDIAPLLALLWESHEHHQRAMAWLSKGRLATCPLTEIGFLRISTQPAYGATFPQAKPPSSRRPARVVGRSGLLCRSGNSVQAVPAATP